MTTEQYLLLQNNINLKLAVALSNYNLLLFSQSAINGHDIGRTKDYTEITAHAEVKIFNKQLILLDKYYNDRVSFEDTTRELNISLPPL